MITMSEDYEDGALDELPDDETEFDSRYSPEELFGKETVEEYGAVRELTADEAADNLQDMQEQYEQLAEEAYETTMEAESIREQLSELSDGDVDYDSWLAAARGKASNLPVLGDRLADVGEKPTLVKQLNMRKESLKNSHEEMGHFAEEVAEYRDEQEQKRQDIVRAKRDKMKELREVEEELATMRNAYEDVEDALESYEPGEEIDLSELDVDHADLGLSPDDDAYFEDLEVHFYDMDDELSEVEDEKTRLDYAVNRLQTKQEIADVMVEAADQTARTVEESYNSLAENLDVYDMAIEGETKIGTAIEQTTATGLLLQDTRELNSDALEAYSEGVREISRAQVALFEQSPVTEDALRSAEDILDEVEEMEKQHAIQADEKTRSTNTSEK